MAVRRPSRSPKKPPSKRSLMVRLDEESKGYLTRAADLRRISVSDYVRSDRSPGTARGRGGRRTGHRSESRGTGCLLAGPEPADSTDRGTATTGSDHARRGVNGVRFPAGWRIEALSRTHPRRAFRSGVKPVDDWLGTRALQHQEKHLSVTKVLINLTKGIAGYFTLATGQVDFHDLPADLAWHLPRRLLPVAILAWLGVSKARQGQGLGRLLLAQALLDCHEAGKTFAFIAVILDCINDEARSFYQKWDFQQLPGSPYRLYLSAKQLEAMTRGN